MEGEFTVVSHYTIQNIIQNCMTWVFKVLSAYSKLSSLSASNIILRV